MVKGLSGNKQDLLVRGPLELSHHSAVVFWEQSPSLHVVEQRFEFGGIGTETPDTNWEGRSFG